MKLIDLEPKWLKYTGRQGAGIRFECPHCRACQIVLLFLNPLDGSPSIPDNPANIGNNGGCRWARSGMTFDDLTLSPSVDVDKHWHGFLTHGEVSIIGGEVTIC